MARKREKQRNGAITEAPQPVPHPPTSKLTTDSLVKLQSTNERFLLDAIDKLRRVGLQSILELPQLVVCGDQSSGKSSVLEAVRELNHFGLPKIYC